MKGTTAMTLSLTPVVERVINFAGAFALLAGLALGAAMFVAQSL
jgi:hypothetical protein